jgi:hypothetical protein
MGFDNRVAIPIDCDLKMHGTTAYLAVLYIRLLASRPVHEKFDLRTTIWTG